MQQITPVTRALLFTNIGFFVLQSLTGPVLIGLFALWPPTSAQYSYAPSFEIWQLLTYGFLHGGLTHLFFNMLALYMFGSEIERLLGARRFLWYYLACIVGAAVTQLLVLSVMIFHRYLQSGHRVGFSDCCLRSVSPILAGRSCWCFRRFRCGPGCLSRSTDCSSCTSV